MRKHFIALLLVSVVATAAPFALAALQDHKDHHDHKAPAAGKDASKAAAKPVTNKTCPVSGEPVSASLRAEYKGQYVYTCCESCLENFKKDPEKYVAKLSAEDREAIKKNEVCPVSKEPIKSDEFRVEDNGRLVYFCCSSCLESYKKKMSTKTATQ